MLSDVRVAMTTFEMAHHVFNRPDDGKMYYWMEECVQYCHQLMTDTFSIPVDEITTSKTGVEGGMLEQQSKLSLEGLNLQLSCS